jgi:hypothetical protein
MAHHIRVYFLTSGYGSSYPDMDHHIRIWIIISGYTSSYLDIGHYIRIWFTYRDRRVRWIRSNVIHGIGNTVETASRNSDAVGESIALAEELRGERWE